MKNLPKISIVIPSYNKGEYIQETLNSIISQNYRNLEVFVQDGGSTDKTIKILKKYTQKYPNIISWVSKKDKGQADAINKGLAKASGDIYTFINADDVYEKGALKTVGEYYNKYPKTLWLAGQGKVIDMNGREISKGITTYKRLLLTINNYQLLLIVNYLMQPSVFLSHRAYKKYGPFIEANKFVMEYELWLSLGRVEMPAIINSCLSRFRLARGTISSTEFKKTLLLDEKIARKYTNNPIILLMHRLHNLGRTVTINRLPV